MSYIFINALGISELLSRILAACGSVDYLIFSVLAYFVIERYGRRKVMMCSAAACSLCWVSIAIALAISQHGGNERVCGAAAVAFFFVFFASFGMGVLGVPWLYPTEINALELRTKGASLAMASNVGTITHGTCSRDCQSGTGLPQNYFGSTPVPGLASSETCSLFSYQYSATNKLTLYA